MEIIPTEKYHFSLWLDVICLSSCVTRSLSRRGLQMVLSRRVEVSLLPLNSSVRGFLVRHKVVFHLYFISRRDPFHNVVPTIISCWQRGTRENVSSAHSGEQHDAKPHLTLDERIPQPTLWACQWQKQELLEDGHRSVTVAGNENIAACLAG